MRSDDDTNRYERLRPEISVLNNSVTVCLALSVGKRVMNLVEGRRAGFGKRRLWSYEGVGAKTAPSITGEEASNELRTSGVWCGGGCMH